MRKVVLRAGEMSAYHTCTFAYYLSPTLFQLYNPLPRRQSQGYESSIRSVQLRIRRLSHLSTAISRSNPVIVWDGDPSN